MKVVSFSVVFFAASTVFAGWNLNLNSGWRVVGGANWNSGLKTDLSINGARAMSSMPVFARPIGASKAEAEDAASAIGAGGRVDLPNGGFVDPDYAGSAVMPEYTWNWYAPAGSYSSGKMNFEYDYVETTSVGEGNLVDNSKSDCDVPGFTIEVQRNLGQWGNFGLDVGFGFNYFTRNNVFKSSGEVYRRTDTTENGTYMSSVEMDQTMADWAKNPDGSYGSGTYDGPGAMLPLLIGGQNAFSFSSKINSISTTTHSMSLNSAADYEEFELMLSVKPYYDVVEWFRVVGTLGAVASRGKLDFEMTAMSGGERIYSDSERFDQWDCYGIGGLGGMFHYASMCVGFDFLTRFCDREIDIDGRSVSGSVERSPWMFRVYVGFEF